MAEAPNEPNSSVGPQASEPRAKRSRTEGSGKPNPLISSTEKCKVCLEPAAIHIHYGAVTCFSCRAFFRRSIQNNSSDAYKCRKEGNCDITMKSRKSCQKCRFDKCLMIGMKSTWVLSEEERYHRFRKHREKVQQTQHKSGSTDDGSHTMDHDDEQAHHSDESNYEQARDSSPNSSMSISGMDSDTERSFYQYNHNLGSPYVSPPSTSPNQPYQHTIRSEVEFEHQRRQPYFQLPLDFSLRSSPPDSHLRFEAHSQMTFPMQFQQQVEEPMTYEPSVRPMTSGSAVESEQDHDRASVHEEVLAERNPADFPLPTSILFPDVLPDVTVDEVSQIKAIARIHDINYKSINFGEELIKEMVMSSVFKVPLSPSATMTAYRLMIQRVTRVAQGLDAFVSLPHRLQSILLKHNADLIVSLRGAVFFEKRKGGLDQILISMGVDDLMAAKNMVMAAMKTTKMERIDYKTFNSLQKVENSQIEERYNCLLERVGATVSFDADLVKMLSYILLFSVNFPDKDPNVWGEVEHIQEVMIGMMQRYLFAQYPKQIAIKLFSGLLHCVADLQELTWIKKQRQLASQATAQIEEEEVLLTEANKPKHFNP